jgi:hypothetical protein
MLKIHDTGCFEAGFYGKINLFGYYQKVHILTAFINFIQEHPFEKIASIVH